MVNMEKICIVKRRIREVESGLSGAEGADLCVLQRAGSTVDGSSNGEPFDQDSFPGTFSTDKLSIELTPAQVDAVRAHPHFKLLAGGAAGKPGIELEHAGDGKVAFNFHLKRAYVAKMLTTQDVATSLQVSKGFVSRLVKCGRLKSYKIGRLRRFALEDVLSLISDSKEFF